MRAGVESILNELLNHRGGPLHDLPRRDLVGELCRQPRDLRRTVAHLSVSASSVA